MKFVRREGIFVNKPVLLHQKRLVHRPIGQIQRFIVHAEHLRIIACGPQAVPGIKAQPPRRHGRVRGVLRGFGFSENHGAALTLPQLLQKHGAKAAVTAGVGNT